MSENNLNESGGIMEIPESIPGGIISSRKSAPKKPQVSSGIVEMREEGKPRLEEEQKRIAEAWKTIEEKQEDIENEYRKIVEERKKIEEEQIRITEEQGKLEREKRKIKSERSDLSWVRRRMKEERERREKEEREHKEQQKREKREILEKEREYNAACEVMNDPTKLEYPYNYKTFSELGERFAKLGDYKDSIIKQRICVETVAAIERYMRRQKIWCDVFSIAAIIVVAVLISVHLQAPLPVGRTKYLLFLGEILVMSVLIERIGDTANNDFEEILMWLLMLYPLFYTFYLFPSAAISAGMGWFGVIISALVPTILGYVIGAGVIGSLVLYYEGDKKRIYEKIKRKYTT